MGNMILNLVYDNIVYTFVLTMTKQAYVIYLSDYYIEIGCR